MSPLPQLLPAPTSTTTSTARPLQWPPVSTSFYLPHRTQVRAAASTPACSCLPPETLTSATTTSHHRATALSTTLAVAVLTTKPSTQVTCPVPPCPAMAPAIYPSRRSLPRASTTPALSWSTAQRPRQLPAWPAPSAALLPPSAAHQRPSATVVSMWPLAFTVHSTDTFRLLLFSLSAPFRSLSLFLSTGALFVSFSSNYSKLANTFNQQ